MTWYRGSMPLAAFLCLLATLVMVVAFDGHDCVDKSQRCQNVSCKTGWMRKLCPKTCGSCTPKSTTPPSTVRFSSTIKTLPTAHDSTTDYKSTSQSSSPTTLKTASTFSSTMARTSAPKLSTFELSTSTEALVTTGRQTTLQNTGCVDTRRECRYWNCTSDVIKGWCPKKCGLCKVTSTASSTHIPSTIKTPTIDDSTTEKISSKPSSTMATTLAVKLTTSVESNTPEKEPFTTRQDFRTTLQITETGTTSMEQRLSDKPTTEQTTNEYSNAYASYSTMGLNVAMVTGIAVTCLLVLAVVIILFIIKRRKKRQGASLMDEPETIMTMQPFSYKRDKPLDNAPRIYDELQGNKGTSNKQLIDDFKGNEPFYHVLEGCSPHQSFQDQQLYACADFSSHENRAFEMSGRTMPSQLQPEVERYETITSNAAHKNKIIKEDKDYKGDVDQPYYHVLENQDSKNQGACDEAPLPVYQPLIEVRQDAAMGHVVDRRNVYQALIGVRYNGVNMS